MCKEKDCDCNGTCQTCKCDTSNKIEVETRRASYREILKVAQTHRLRIVKTLKEYGEGLTASELSLLIMNDGERQKTAPRLTELKKAGIVRVVGKRINENTGKLNSIYEVI